MNEELLLGTVSDFVDAAEYLPDLLVQYVSEGDIENYTIKVHALKSSSRMIGATALSDAAASLEVAADEGRERDLIAGHGAMMESYAQVAAAVAATVQGFDGFSRGQLNTDEPVASGDGEAAESLSDDDIILEFMPDTDGDLR